MLKGQHFWAQDGMKGVFGKSIDLDWIPRYMVVDREGKIAFYNAIQADDAAMIKVLKKLQKKKVKKRKPLVQVEGFRKTGFFK